MQQTSFYPETMIKTAFWLTFHGAGELWFPPGVVLNPEEGPHSDAHIATLECETAVEEMWEYFWSNVLCLVKPHTAKEDTP